VVSNLNQIYRVGFSLDKRKPFYSPFYSLVCRQMDIFSAFRIGKILDLSEFQIGENHDFGLLLLEHKIGSD
jgi:hypothetical protein